MLVDRSVNPIEENYDIAIGGRAGAYDGVIDEPLCRLRQVLCAAPDYLAATDLTTKGRPAHPRDLLDHPCLVFSPTGNTWRFEGARGPVSVDVPVTLSSNDNHMLYSAACAGTGIAILPSYVARQAMAEGMLIEVLEDFALQSTWLKAQVPARKTGLRRVQVLLEWLKSELGPVPPWEA
jgi:DNA-binding transcriptional LysR family regulator